MPSYTLQGKAETGGTVTPLRQPARTTVADSRTAERAGLDELRSEIRGYLRMMQAFPTQDPDQVLLQISGFHARAAEIRSYLVSNESRLAQALRTKEVEPFLDHCDFQFRIHSRLQSIREMDFKISGGQV